MVRMTWTSKSKGKAAAGKVDDFKKRLDHVWDIGAPDTTEVIRRYCLLSVACKEEDIAFYIYQQDPRKESMSGNKYLPPRRRRNRREEREESEMPQ